MAAEDDVVEKNVVGGGEASVMMEERRPSAAAAAYEPVRVSADPVSEIKSKFERAADSGREVSKMLEEGKLSYHRRNAVHKASSRMRHAITSSILAPSASLVNGNDASLCQVRLPLECLIKVIKVCIHI